MGSGAIKWHVHCSVCGAFIEKSAQNDLIWRNDRW